jgi:hypothetical protein
MRKEQVKVKAFARTTYDSKKRLKLFWFDA